MECHPIPPLDLPPRHPERGWTKLTTFGADLHGLRGTALFLDLDVVIVDDITPFFEVPGEFLIIHDWKRPWRDRQFLGLPLPPRRAHADLLQYFREHVDEVRAGATSRPTCRTSCTSRASWPTGPPTGARAGSTTASRASPTNYWREPFIPRGARILIFHGVMNPPDALAGRRNGNWRFARAAPWIATHWVE